MTKNLDRHTPKLDIFFTEDETLLQQFYELRDEIYVNENGWKYYKGTEKKFDLSCRIIVVVSDGELVGGMRVMFSDENNFLSNELPGTQYEYRKVVRFDNRDLVIAEISALIVKKEFRSSETKLRMFDLALKKIKEHGCHYVFGLAMIQTCRSYRDDFAKLNYFLEIITNYPWRREDFFNFIDIFPIYSQFEAI